MQIARLLLIVGIWTAVLPYLGFPLIIKNILFIFTGLVLIYLSLLQYKKAINLNKDSLVKSFENFSESIPTPKKVVRVRRKVSEVSVNKVSPEKIDEVVSPTPITVMEMETVSITREQ